MHDIVEIYAWDVDAMRRTPDAELLKQQQEERALQRLIDEYPEGNALWQSLTNYEHQVDDESKFVYALDKFLPVMNIYNDWGYRRRERDISLDEELKLAKEKKIEISPHIIQLRNELYVRMKSDESNLFNKRD